jgi:phage virion morphogenesis protein
MNAPVNVQTVGLEPVQSLLRRMQENAGNVRPALTQIGRDFSDRIRQQFKQGISPYGERWAALSAVTQSRNKGKRTGGKPLLDRGDLRKSISSYVNGNSSVSIGSGLKYAGLHQFGARQGQFGRTRRNGPIPWGNVPARPYMPIQNGRTVLPLDWSNAAEEIVSSHIIGGGT